MGCGQPAWEGDGEFEGVACTRKDPALCDNFHFPLRVGTLQTFGPRAMLRMRSGQYAADFNDEVSLIVLDRHGLPLETPLPVGPGRAEDDPLWLPVPVEKRIRGAVGLLDSFPRFEESVEPGPGAVVVFTAFGQSPGQSVEGRLFIPLQGRHDGASRGHVEGWFRFRVEKPPPINPDDIRP